MKQTFFFLFICALLAAYIKVLRQINYTKFPVATVFLFNLISLNGIANKQIEDSPFYLLLVVSTKNFQLKSPIE